MQTFFSLLSFLFLFYVIFLLLFWLWLLWLRVFMGHYMAYNSKKMNVEWEFHPKKNISISTSRFSTRIYNLKTRNLFINKLLCSPCVDIDCRWLVFPAWLHNYSSQLLLCDDCLSNASFCAASGCLFYRLMTHKRRGRHTHDIIDDKITS